MDFENEIFGYLQGITDVIKKVDLNEFNNVINHVLKTYDKNGNIYIFGNGGSASTASHFANDFNKGVSEYLNKKFNFFCLNDNVATISAIANDIGYDYIYEFQLKNRLKSDDFVIGISGSGNSKNIILAVEYAKSLNVKTLSLTGFDGGKLRKITDYSLHIPVDNMQISEDLHLIINHAMMSILSKYLIE